MGPALIDVKHDCPSGDRRFSILFVTYRLSGGGAERALVAFANALVKRGHAVSVYSFELAENEYWLDPAVVVHYSSKAKTKGFLGKLLKYRFDANAVGRIYRSGSFDFVIPFCTEMVCCSFFGLLGTSASIVATERNHPLDGCKSRAKRALRDFVYRRCEAVWVQTEAQAKFYRAFCDCPVFVVGNIGLMPERAWELSSSRAVRKFMTAGRLAVQKNQGLMVEAFGRVVKLYPDATLEIFGCGPLEAELQTRIDGLGLSQNVRIMGHSSDIGSEYYKHDAFIFTSDFEGMPNALIEAMLAGMPVITTDFESVDDIVKNGLTGIVVKRGSVDMVAAGVLFLIGNPSDAAEMGGRARSLLGGVVGEEAQLDLLLDCLEMVANE